MDVRVRTAAGGMYVIRDASAFGPDAIAGRPDGSPSALRIFHLADDDEVEEF